MSHRHAFTTLLWKKKLFFSRLFCKLGFERTLGGRGDRY